MIATVAAHSRSATPRQEFEHLLLGDLRELLNDYPSRDRDRWLLATLDMLLVFRPRASQVYLPALPRDPHFLIEAPSAKDLPVRFELLQRLRDRIAHRAPYETLAQELIVDLRFYFDGAQSKFAPILPLG